MRNRQKMKPFSLWIISQLYMCCTVSVLLHIVTPKDPFWATKTLINCTSLLSRMNILMHTHLDFYTCEDLHWCHMLDPTCHDDSGVIFCWWIFEWTWLDGLPGTFITVLKKIKIWKIPQRHDQITPRQNLITMESKHVALELEKRSNHGSSKGWK